MANIFTLLLVIATAVTGLLWCLDKLTPRSQRSKSSTGESFFPVLAFVLVFRSFLYEPFRIPSGSMMPTLLIGDFILVEKFSYGIKDPIYQNTWIETGHPQRGDIVVFKYPKDPNVNYIKRAVGLPGDTVTYNPRIKQLTIQPQCSSGQFCNYTLPIIYSNVEESDFVQTFSYRNNGEVVSKFWRLSNNENTDLSEGIRLTERKETLDDVTHRILMLPVSQDEITRYYQQGGQPLATWVVPPGNYFMMGDNRDNSADSRYWGFVPEENLIGKATAIWMSFEEQQDEWPTGLRLSRIGKIQ